MDAELVKFLGKLIKDKEAMELVPRLKPLEIVKILVTTGELCPKDASKTTVNLLKHAHDVHYEGLQEAKENVGYWVNRKTGEKIEVPYEGDLDHLRYLRDNPEKFGIKPAENHIAYSDSPHEPQRPPLQHVMKNFIKVTIWGDSAGYTMSEPFVARDLKHIQHLLLVARKQPTQNIVHAGRKRSINLSYNDFMSATQPGQLRMEGLSGGSIETNKQYPLPPVIRFKKKDVEDLEEPPSELDELSVPGGKTNITPKFVVQRHHFPPDPRDEPEGWPYDDMTVAALKPSNRSPKRPLGGLHSGKNPLKQDLGKRQPGISGPGFGKQSIGGKTGDMPGSGRSWTSKGTKGWNSPPEKEFEDPTQDPTLKKKPRRYRFSQTLESPVGEIKQDRLDGIEGIEDYMSGEESLSFDKFFGEKDRLLFNFESEVGQAGEIVKLFRDNGYQIDAKNALVTKDGRKYRIGKLLTKLFSLMKVHAQAWSAQARARAVARGVASGAPTSAEQEAAVDRAADKATKEIIKFFPALDSKKAYRPIDLTLGDAKGHMDFWNEKSEHYRKHPQELFKTKTYAVVLSRSPMDVIRMSDFEHMESCHSPSGDHFHCAVGEAKGHGLVAYVVDPDDMPEDFDLEDDEIFEDDDRDIPGVVPLSRVRLRKYETEDGEEEYAVPEQSIYGERIPGFEEAVQKWAKENQDIENIPGHLVRKGGSYADTTDSTLLDSFFDKPFEGKITVKPEAGSVRNALEIQREIWDNESNEILVEYKEKFKHSYVDYDMHDVDEDEVSVTFNGSTSFKMSELGANEDEIDHLAMLARSGRTFERIKNAFETEFSDFNSWEDSIYLGEASWGDDVIISVDHGSQEDYRTPDGFKGFCMEILEQWDEEKSYEKAKRALRKAFLAEGLVDSSGYENLERKIGKGKEIFKNFETETDREEIEITSPAISFYTRGFEQNYKEKIQNYIHSQEFATSATKFLSILVKKGKGSLEPMNDNFSFMLRDIGKPATETAQIKFWVTIKPLEYKDDELNEIMDAVRVLDQNVDQLSPMIQQIFDKFTKTKLDLTKRTLELDISRELERLLKKQWQPSPDVPQYLKGKTPIDVVLNHTSGFFNKVRLEYFDLADFWVAEQIVSDLNVGYFLSDISIFSQRDNESLLLIWAKAILSSIQKEAQKTKAQKVYFSLPDSLDTTYVSHIKGNINTFLDKSPAFEKIDKKDIEWMNANLAKLTKPISPTAEFWEMKVGELREDRVKKYVFKEREKEELPGNELELTKNAPVGSAVPTMNWGGRVPDRRLGFRRR